MTRYLIPLGGILAVLAILLAYAFYLGADRERGRQAEDRLEAIEKSREIEDEVDALDDDALRDGILRRGR